MKTFYFLFSFLFFFFSLSASQQDGAIYLSPSETIDSDLENALKELEGSEGGVIHFNPGTYHFKKTVHVNIPDATGVALRGSGMGVTRLIFKEIDCAFRVKLRTNIKNYGSDGTFEMSNLTILSDGLSGKAIYITPNEEETRGGVGLKDFSNLYIGGLTGDSFWKTGIHTNNITFCHVDKLTYRAPIGKGVGLIFSGDSAPVDHHINSFRSLGGEIGIQVQGTTEGVYINQATMIACDIGIEWNTDSFEPLLLFTNSHINANRFCIRARNLLQPIIKGNLLYQRQSSYDWVGLSLESDEAVPYDLLQISNNIFHGDPNVSGKSVGVNIEACGGGVLTNNVFSAVDPAISLGKSVKNLNTDGSVFKNSSTPYISKE